MISFEIHHLPNDFIIVTIFNNFDTTLTFSFHNG